MMVGLSGQGVHQSDSNLPISRVSICPDIADCQLCRAQGYDSGAALPGGGFLRTAAHPRARSVGVRWLPLGFGRSATPSAQCSPWAARNCRPVRSCLSAFMTADSNSPSSQGLVHNPRHSSPCELRMSATAGLQGGGESRTDQGASEDSARGVGIGLRSPRSPVRYWQRAVTPLSQLQDELAGVHALARLDLDRPHHARDRGANALL